MSSNLQLGQKLGMSLDDLIKKTQASKKKATPAKANVEKKKPGAAKKATKAKPAANAKGKRPNKGAESQSKTTKPGGAIRKNTAKKANRAATLNAPKVVPANPRKGNRPVQTTSTSVGDLLNMNVSVSSKRDAQAAMKIAKQLEAEARKYLGPPAASQQQHHRGPVRAQQRQPADRPAQRPPQRQPPRQPQRQPPRQVPQQQLMQQRRVPYAVAHAPHWPEPAPQNFLTDHDRMSDRDSEQMDMDEPDLKPNLASLQAQATQFARGVRGQSRR